MPPGRVPPGTEERDEIILELSRSFFARRKFGYFSRGWTTVRWACMVLQANPGAPIEAISFGLTDVEAARFLGVSVRLLQKWRCEGRGPRFRRIGSLCRYSMPDLRDFWEALPSGGAFSKSEALP